MIQVAFCSESGSLIDSHFASSPSFFIYEIGTGISHYVGKISLVEPTADSGRTTGEEDKVSLRIKALHGCSIVYCAAIGGPAAARLVQNNIYPLKALEGTSIEEASQKLSQVLKNNPPPWLRKKLETGKGDN